MQYLARAMVWLTLVVALAACPRSTRKTLVPDVPQNGADTDAITPTSPDPSAYCHRSATSPA